MLEVTITKNDLKKALNELPEKLERELRLASKREAVNIEAYAKANHRFTTRKSKLVKSIKGYGGVDIKKRGIFTRILGKYKLDTEVRIVLHDKPHPLGTEYGKYVHGGWQRGKASWAADRFIDEAIEKNKKRVIAAWDKAIEKVAKGF